MCVCISEIKRIKLSYLNSVYNNPFRLWVHHKVAADAYWTTADESSRASLLRELETSSLLFFFSPLSRETSTVYSGILKGFLSSCSLASSPLFACYSSPPPFAFTLTSGRLLLCPWLNIHAHSHMHTKKTPLSDWLLLLLHKRSRKKKTSTLWFPSSSFSCLCVYTVVKIAIAVRLVISSGQMKLVVFVSSSSSSQTHKDWIDSCYIKTQQWRLIRI